MSRRSVKRPRFSVGGQPVFENEDSSNHSGLGVAEYDENSLSQQPETSTNSSDQQHFPQNQFVPSNSKNQQHPLAKSANDDMSNLNRCLDYLVRLLSDKDKEGFFQYPVTDQLAPGYSSIITHPMDFSTIRKKISQDEYSNLSEFRADIELMCENALKYNRLDTIYYQAAKKLLASATKLLSKEKFIQLRETNEHFTRLTDRELGFSLETTNNDQQQPPPQQQQQQQIVVNSHEPIKPKVPLKLPKYYEKLPGLLVDEEDDEDFSPEDVLSQAQQAAQCSREKLSLRRPQSIYKLTCQRPNGTTSLRFINQDDFSHQQQSQTRTITIGELSNMSTNTNGYNHSHTTTTTTTPIVNETEKRNHLLPRYYLDYGPFASHAPQYDSSFTSLSKDDLDLLIHTYGSEFSGQYSVSLIDYVKDSGDLALASVDKYFKNNDESIEPTNSNVQHEFDRKLDENARLLIQLRQAQYDRLCQPSNRMHQLLSSSSSSNQPTEPINENELAEKVLTNLSDLTHLSSNKSTDVIQPETIRHNLGVIVDNNTNSN